MADQARYQGGEHHRKTGHSIREARETVEGASGAVGRVPDLSDASLEIGLRNLGEASVAASDTIKSISIIAGHGLPCRRRIGGVMAVSPHEPSTITASGSGGNEGGRGR